MTQRKIIHIDMDCFYAAIEIRDRPELANQPVAVGGPKQERSVLCTCNYIARKFGVRSAMSTAYALRLCPNLIVLPVNMKKYREVAKIIQKIFLEFTDLVEPLSLDEAYLDVTHTSFFHSSATLIAKEIQKRIASETHLTASAGVAPNKFLAKIASGWKKPNGLFVITPNDVENFVHDLPVEKIHGVGKVTSQKLNQLGIKTCADIQALSLPYLINHFGKMGQQLYEQSRGIDHRSVEPNRVRKSLSVERTFSHDIQMQEDCFQVMNQLYVILLQRIKEYDPDRPIKSQFIKIKFSDFKLSTLERHCDLLSPLKFQYLLQEILKKSTQPIRLIGLGVHFAEDKKIGNEKQFCLLLAHP